MSFIFGGKAWKSRFDNFVKRLLSKRSKVNVRNWSIRSDKDDGSILTSSTSEWILRDLLVKLSNMYMNCLYVIGKWSL